MHLHSTALQYAQHSGADTKAEQYVEYLPKIQQTKSFFIWPLCFLKISPIGHLDSLPRISSFKLFVSMNGFNDSLVSLLMVIRMVYM